MKKLIMILLTGVLAVSLAACGSTGTSADGTPTDIGPTQNVEEEQSESDTLIEDEGNDNDTENYAEKAKADTLVIYFSANNINDVDAVSSATPMIDGASSVQWMAERIHETVGGDIVAIMPTVDYPLEYDALADYAKDEADRDARPDFLPLDIDPSNYKTVFLGYPIWWYRMPMILETFFDTYDFDGVTIIPFNAHEGSRDGGTYDMIKDREPNASVLDGLAISGRDVGNDASKEAIAEWIEGLDLE